MSKHIEQLQTDYPELDSCAADIELAFSALRTGYATDGKVLLCGNGGNSDLAQQWATLMLSANGISRNLDPFWKTRFSPELAGHLQGALPTIPLGGFTDFSAKVDGQYAFAQLVWALGKAADVLVGISSDGACANILAAFETAASLDIIPIALASGDGGPSAALADICIKVPSQQPSLVPTYHKAIIQCLARLLEEEYFG